MRYKIFITAVLIGIGFMIGSGWQNSFNQKQFRPLTKQSEVLIMFNNGQNTPVVFSEAAGQTLFNATQKIATKNQLGFEAKDYGNLGKLITKIMDQSNGDDQKYWQFWVNNQQLMGAADNYQIKANDVINWNFTKSNQ